MIIEVCESVTNSLTMNTCDGVSLVYEGVTLPAGTTTPVVLTAINGCDSIVQVTIIDNSSYSETEIYTACAGTEFNYLGTMISAGSTQQFDYTTINGCDSTIIVTVNELSVLPTNEIFSACAGDSIIYNGTTILAGSSQAFTYTNYQGCDSTVTVEVTEILPLSDTEIYTVCNGETFEYNGVSLAAGETETFFFSSSQGCDSIVNVIVDAFAPLIFELSSDIICPGSSTGEIMVNNISGGEPPYQFSINGEAPQDEFIFGDLTPDEYSIRMIDANNCQLEETFLIESYEPIELIFEEKYIIPCEEESVVLSPIVMSGSLDDLVFIWEGVEEGIDYEVSSPGIFRVEATNFCGSQTFDVNVVLDDFNEDLIYIPNAFSPNGDGINDVFKPSMSMLSEVESYELVIFSRWGSRIFTSKNLEDGWRGGIGRGLKNSGVYIYTLKAKVNICGRTIDIQESGDITLLR